MSNFIIQQAAQARVAEEIHAAQLRAQARAARRARRATRARRPWRFHLAIGHVAHA